MTIEKSWRADAVDETIRPEDAAAIQRCLLDYFDGWFDGHAARRPALVVQGSGHVQAARDSVLINLLIRDFVAVIHPGFGGGKV